MTKSCGQLVKIDTSSASINHDDQNVFMRKDSDKFEGQQRKGSTNDIFRQSSQKFIQKLRNISLNPMIAKNETAKSTDKPNQTSKDISLARQYSTEPIDRPKLRGILKTANRNTSSSNPIDPVYNDLPDGSRTEDDPTKILDDSTGATCSTMNATRVIKQVRFKEKISKKRYPPSEPIVSGGKLSDRQQKFLEKTHRRDSLNLQSVHINSISSIDSSEFQESDCFESSEEDLMGGDT